MPVRLERSGALPKKTGKALGHRLEESPHLGTMRAVSHDEPVKGLQHVIWRRIGAQREDQRELAFLLPHRQEPQGPKDERIHMRCLICQVQPLTQFSIPLPANDGSSYSRVSRRARFDIGKREKAL